MPLLTYAVPASSFWGCPRWSVTTLDLIASSSCVGDFLKEEEGPRQKDWVAKGPDFAHEHGELGNRKHRNHFFVKTVRQNKFAVANACCHLSNLPFAALKLFLSVPLSYKSLQIQWLCWEDGICQTWVTAYPLEEKKKIPSLWYTQRWDKPFCTPWETPQNKKRSWIQSKGHSLLISTPEFSDIIWVQQIPDFFSQ